MASSDQNLAQCKEEAQQAGSNLEDAHRKIESCLLQDKKKADIIKDLHGQLEKLQEESVAAEKERVGNRYPQPHPWTPGWQLPRVR